MSLKSFQQQSSTDNADKTMRYVSYVSKYPGNTMILYSAKTRRPLAALIFKTKSKTSILTARPSPQQSAAKKQQESSKQLELTCLYFQGMVDEDEKEFAFTLVNLSKDWINFNILHTPHRVSEVDPGPSFGVNAVNELQSEQEYTVECDQRTKRNMILSGLTITKMDSKTNQVEHVPLSVNQDEKTSSEDSQAPKGTYFYLSIVAREKTETTKLFAEGTEWKCCDYFIQKKEPSRGVNFMISSGRDRWGSQVGLETQLYDDVDDEDHIRSGRAELNVLMQGPGMSRILPGQHIPEGAFMNFGAPMDTAPLNDSRRRAKRKGRSLRPDHFAEEPAYRGQLELHSLSVDSDATEQPVVEQCLMTVEYPADDAFADNHGSRLPEIEDQCLKRSDNDVGESQAAQVRQGDREIQEHYANTGNEYDYEHPSCLTVLGLSICKDLKLTPLSKEELNELVNLKVNEMMESEHKDMIAALPAVFRSDYCVIDQESPVDTVIIQCGHACLNYANRGDLRKCPLCRQHITAFVKLSSLST